MQTASLLQDVNQNILRYVVFCTNIFYQIDYLFQFH